MLRLRRGHGVSAFLLATVIALNVPVGAQGKSAGAEHGVCSRVHCMPTVKQRHDLCIVGCVGSTGTNQLTYNGGPVEAAPVGVYLVFWGSQWNNDDPSGEAALLQSFFTGTGASAWNNTVTQYCQGVPPGTMYCNGSGTPVGNNAGMLKGVWYDNAGVAPPSPTQSDLAAEAARAASHWGNTSPTSNLNVQYAIETATGNNSSGFGTQYCAWHSSTSSSAGLIAYTNAPYITDAGGSCGANFNSLGPNAGITIVGGHEYAETETDPVQSTGWIDSGNAEIGDKCAWISAGQGAVANVSFSTGTFPVQSLWSDAFNNDGGGCVQTSSLFQLHSNKQIFVRSNGEADVVAQGPNNSLDYYDALPGGPWNLTVIAGSGTTFSEPSIVVRDNGEADVVAQGSNNSLDYYEAVPGGPWNLTVIAGSATTFAAPSIFVRSSGGEADVVAQGANNSLDYYFALPGSSWASTVVAGSGTTFSQPSIFVRSSGEADVVAQGANNSADYYFALPSSPWVSTVVAGSGTTFSAPAIFVRSSSGEADVVAQGANNTLDYYFAVAAAPWVTTVIAGSGTTFSAPSIFVRSSSGEADVVAQGANSALDYYFAVPAGPWSLTVIAGSGTTFSAPSIFVRSSSGEADAVAQGANNSLDYYFALPSSPWNLTVIAASGTTF
jgi:hypothetical protein